MEATWPKKERKEKRRNYEQWIVDDVEVFLKKIMNNGYDVVLNLNKLNIYEKLEQYFFNFGSIKVLFTELKIHEYWLLNFL